MLKKILSLSVLLLLSASLLFSDYSFTEAEMVAMETASEISEKALIQQEITISNQEQQLRQLKTLQQISEKITSGQLLVYEQSKKYLKQQEKEQTVKRIRAFLYGAAAGFAGLYILENSE